MKYLYHCPRQLWLYVRGIRPEHLSDRVQLGEAVHETSYRRSQPVDLGAAKLDHLDGALWVHEVKSSAVSRAADNAQAIHYCYRLHEVGIDAKGAILHYPATRRTIRIPYTTEQAAKAAADVVTVLETVAAPSSPPRLARPACKGCSYIDYCWME
ncbi:CRISPR-associated protein Cas4 [Acrocarpospora pleiomorpha]|uniref:CRISPR-associated protein Cas4 n=1 Tax=Acrocarpospora pleiomorpha TaxID=90975 RepID=UPI001FEC096B|nr:CRISPR-associated protein Cas4 [Acrocarpospora pleiomorpha]